MIRTKWVYIHPQLQLSGEEIKGGSEKEEVSNDEFPDIVLTKDAKKKGKQRVPRHCAHKGC